MGIFSRLFKEGQAQAHAVVDKLEDPIKLTEQGIRDLKTDLQNAMTGLAEVKGVSIRLTKESEDAKRQADEYERKAMLLLQRFKDGQLDQAQAERLATEALNQKESISQRAARLGQDAEQQQRMAAQLQDKVNQLKTTITTYEQELITLRGRAKTAEFSPSQTFNSRPVRSGSKGEAAIRRGITGPAATRPSRLSAGCARLPESR